LHSLEWPPTNAVSYLGDYPEDSNPGWTNNIQGVAHDDSNWFFTQDVRLWRIPLSHDLEEAIIPIFIDDNQFLNAPIPSSLEEAGGDHMGDPDHHEGLLYVPLEGTSPPRILIFQGSNLNFIDSAPLTAQNDAPWCAINPLNGLLYSSPFNSDHLTVYKRLPIGNSHGGSIVLELEHLYDFPLFDSQGSPVSLLRIQGGAFSPSGHLYLVSDVDSGGVLGFDMTTGRKIFQRTKESLPTGAEMEGITIWDVDPLSSPHIGGQIHVVWLQDEAIVDDDLYFSHFRVPAEHRGRI
jgi:hypothetical protein